MKIIIISLCIACYAFGIYGQPNKMNLQLEGDTIAPVKQLTYSLNTGSMFYSGSLKGSTFYIAPEFSYVFSKKFSMTGGVIFMNNNYNFSSGNQSQSGTETRLFAQPNKYEAIVYARGNYQVNSKLTISGTLIKNFNDQSSNTLQNQAWNNSFQMMSMGLNYKLTPHMTIGAGVRFIQGNALNSPSMYNFNSPFYPMTMEEY
jgi:hypothetical protein